MDADDLASATVEETCSKRARQEPAAAAHLFLLLECERPRAGGARHDLAHIDHVHIGRGPELSATRGLVQGLRVLELRVPDVRMSRHHARLERRGAAFFFEDLGSTNGSRVGGARAATPIEMSDGEVVEVGRTFFRFRAALATPRGAPAEVYSTQKAGLAAFGITTLLPALFEQHVALAKIATSRVPVMLLGETGTGKELLARAIHGASGRKGRFVAVNCGAIPATLVEAQLFGHVRGAFSGATRDEPGFVRSAHQGTLFLDEVGDLPKAAQAALLRVLQESEVVPVGSARPERVDLRVVSATHHPIHQAVTHGSFRSDLFARLASFQYAVAPLRERMEDLGLLVAALLSRHDIEHSCTPTFTPEAARALLRHGWPLNVRELESSLAVAVALAGEGPIDVEHLPLLGDSSFFRKKPRDSLDEPLRAQLVRELQGAGGNVAHVARTMGKARMQIQRWMKRLDINPKTFRP